MRRADGTGSRLSMFLRTDDMGGGGWIRWGLLSHAFVVAGAIGLAGSFLRRDYDEIWLGIAIWLGSIASTAGFWWLAVRTWRRLPEPTMPAEPDRRAVVYDPNGAGDESVRRLA